jgi:serine protease Do
LHANKRWILLVVSALLGGVFAFWNYPLVNAQEAGDTNEINKSIVWVDIEHTGQVEVPFDDGTTEIFESIVTVYCTGWFVSTDGHVGTAGHCIEQDDSTVNALFTNVIIENDINIGDQEVSQLDWYYSLEEPVAYVGQPSVIDGPLSDKDGPVAQIIDHQPFENGDNALLKVSGMSDTPPLQVAVNQPTVGEEVVSIGYAGSVDDVTDTNRQPPSQKKGSVSSLSTTNRGVPVTEIDAAVTGGMSGGPTINADGAVIGINSFGIVGESQPFNFITDTQTMRTFLEKNGVPIDSQATDDTTSGTSDEVEDTSTVSSTDSSSDDSMPAWAIAGLVLLAIAVIALVVYVLRLKGQQQSGANKPQTEEQETSEV